MNRKYKILFLVNVDWFFISHRLPIALEALKNGAEVWVVTTDTGSLREIESYGFKVIDFPFSRSGTNYFTELLNLPRLFRIYAKIKPDLVHHVTIKPIIYGSLVSRAFKKLSVVNAVTGMGFAFSEDKKASRLKFMIQKAYRMALNNNNARVIFQNSEDRDLFIKNDLVKQEQVKIIRGSGVNTDLFKPNCEYPTNPELIVLLASRMIWDKGINEFVEAAEIVKKEWPQVRFILAGRADDGNPNMVPLQILNQWVQENKVEWLGHYSNMVELFQRAAIVTLPTFYPEGVPKVLIEAASMCKPIITTDWPGCRDIVKDGVNGILIPEKNSTALAEAIIKLIENPELREIFGEKGRQIVLDEYTVGRVVTETMNLYDQLLGEAWRNQSQIE
jgi:glycosyltransferase involved in cell wall biosynthesis